MDDLTLSLSGEKGRVAGALAEVTDAVVKKFVSLGMIVSTAKSVVVASRPSLAKDTVAATATKAIKPAAHAKLLGVATAGGRKRCMKVANARIKKVRKLVPKLQALRRNNCNTKLMARAAGTAALTYGVDCYGMANTQLATARTTIARAATAGAGGKNSNRALHVLDGEAGTLDPASDAHALGLKHWAVAWWEGCIPQESLKQAFDVSSDRSARCYEPANLLH